jgi:hypothetical protein
MTEQRRKTATLNLRIDPDIKAALERAAADDHRNVTQLVELLVMRHLRAGGYLPAEESKPRRSK